MSYYNINIYSVLKEFIIEEKIWIEEEHHTTNKSINMKKLARKKQRSDNMK